MSAITSSEKKRRFIMFSVGGLALAVVIVLLSFLLFGKSKPAASVLSAARSDAVKGQAGGQGSAEYNRKLEEHDAQKANAALTAGASHIPTPVGKPGASIVSKKQDTPPPPAAAPAVAATTRIQPSSAPVRSSDLSKRMLEDLAALDARMAAYSGQGKIVYQADFPKDAKESGDEKPVSKSDAPPAPSMDLKPGDLLYAVIDTGVNSDVPSAVMATIASGKYSKARLLGKFQRFEERLVLSFSRAILPSGEDMQIEAYAVDPATTEASVASSVDTHFLSRWGGLIASAFLEGLAQAKRYSGATSTVYGVGLNNGATDQMVWNNYSLEDQAWIAAGKVGEKSSKIFEKNFDRPPTVYLQSGTAIGVLVLSVKKR